MKKVFSLKHFAFYCAALSLVYACIYQLNVANFGKTSIFNIADGDVAGLITAINNANNEIANPGPDTINLASSGTYTLTAIDNITVEGDTGLPAITSNITINGNNSTIQRSSVVGTPNLRIMSANATGVLTLNDLIIKNGKTSSSTAGGGLRLAIGSIATLNNVTFDGNTTLTSGGAIRHSGTGVLTINNSNFQNNTASSSGGAIVNDPSTTVITNMFINNTTLTGNIANSAAGAIENTGKAALDNVDITNNTSAEGGGIRNRAGIMTITNSTIDGNTASTSGGGGMRIYPSSTTTITNTLIQNNQSGSTGGGIYQNGISTLTINDSTITGNTSITGGAGITNISTGANVNLDNTVVSNNIASGVNSTGGGIFSTSNLNISNNSVIESNSASRGGGILCNSACVADIQNSTIQNNTATTNGGGIFSENSAIETINNTLITGNTANIGGGIRKDGTGTMTIQNSTISNNTAGFVGGGITMNANLSVEESTIENNIASLSNPSSYGGGLATGNTGNTTSLTNVTITNNTASSAAGVDFYSVTNLENVTISENSTPGNSGGIKIEASGQVSIKNTTITNNTADSDNNGTGTNGGLQVISGANITMSNSIIAANIDGTPAGASDQVDCGGTAGAQINSSGYNIIGEINTSANSCGFIPAQGDQVGTTLSPINPLLGLLANNGGSTQTHMLLIGSPAIDAGSPQTVGTGGNSCAASDQRGVTRPADGNADMVQICDIGSTEYDPPQVMIQHTAGTTDVSESGTTDTYAIFLNTLPTGNVTVNITPDAQLSTDAASLTFTTSDWFTPQYVTVSAQDDLVAEGIHGGTITHSASSSDNNYDSIAIIPLSVSITDNDTEGVTILESSGSTDVDESGSGDDYQVVLNTMPTDDVTVNITPDSQSTTNTASLTFTTLDWNIPQTVNVNALDDQIAEQNHTGTISHSSTSNDPLYNSISIQEVQLNITDNDTAGITLTESGGDTSVEEGGLTDTYEIVLTSEPVSDVTITILPGTQVSASLSPTFTFTPSNWNTPQTITVTAIDDLYAEADHIGTIIHSASSADLNYDGLAIPNVIVSIADNEVAGLIFNIPGGAITASEGGVAQTYTIVLSAAPLDDVVVHITSDSQLNILTPILTFTSTDWNIPQTVSVEAAQDLIVENTHNGTMSFSITSSATSYSTLIISDLIATILDDDIIPTPPPPPPPPTTVGDQTAGGRVETQRQPKEADEQKIEDSIIPKVPAATIIAKDCIRSQNNEFPIVDAYQDGKPIEWIYNTFKRCIVDGKVVKKNRRGEITSKFDPFGKTTRAEVAKIAIISFYPQLVKINDKGTAEIDYETRPLFTDVPESHWFYEWAAFAVDHNIIEFKPESPYFKPDATVPRAEALGMILRATEFPIPNVEENVDFSDIKPSDWFYSYIKYGKKIGIIEGFTVQKNQDGKQIFQFKPQDPILRTDLVKIIDKFLGPIPQNIGF